MGGHRLVRLPCKAAPHSSWPRERVPEGPRVFAEFGGERAGEAEHAVLGRRVGG